MKELVGAFTVAITPMTEDQELDLEGLKRNLDHYIKQGTGGVCCCGSTGEFVSLTPDERKAVAETTVQHVNGRVPVIVGTAAEATRECIDFTRHAQEIGADGALIINSWYAKPGPEEILAHFKAVSDATDIQIMAYNNPGTSGIDMPPELIASLCELDGVDYVKESSGDIRRVRELLRLSDGKIKVFCGADDLALESFMIGAVGWISVCSNIIPKACQELFVMGRLGDYERARDAYGAMLPLLNYLEGSGKYVHVTKAALNRMGLAAGPARFPRLPLSDEEMANLDAMLASLDLL